MFHSIYREKFRGLGVGRVGRDQNFTANLGFYHNEYQIQYIFEGERYFFFDGSCCHMEAGTLCFTDKRNIVRTCIIGGQYHDRLLLEMEEGYFSLLCDQLGINLQAFFAAHHGVYQTQHNACVQDIIGVIDELMRSKEQKGREQKIKLAVLTLMAEAEKWEDTRANTELSGTMQNSIDKQKKVYEVADYISEHYAEIQSVDELSERFYMSKSYLCRIFREVTNFTISEYVNLHRIAASQEYLMDSGMSMQEIAEKLGYESLTYFERVFKKQLSVTPLQYRKMRGNRGMTSK